MKAQRQPELSGTAPLAAVAAGFVLGAVSCETACR